MQGSTAVVTPGESRRLGSRVYGVTTLLAGLGLMASSCGRTSGPDRRSPQELDLRPTRGYILISFDTLRADHLGAYGYERPTSPVFDGLARRGVLFERAVVQYPSTLTSHMSIFTGTYPQQHAVLPPSGVLSAAITTLPEHFRAHGFRTAGHTEGGFVAGGFGFARGFEQFTDTAYAADTDIERTFARGLEFLRILEEAERFFLFLHTYTIHDPYDPPIAHRGRFWPEPEPVAADSTGETLRRWNEGEITLALETVDYFRAMYDASIRYADEVLGEFMEELEAVGLLDDTTLVITSDHGEEFLEHGKLAHTQLYPECLLVPLLIVHPDLTAGRRVDQTVETVDIAPTLFELAGVSIPDSVAGISLVRQMKASGRRPGSSQAYAEVFGEEFVRTLLVENGGRRLQLLRREPEKDPGGAWIRRRFAFDAEQANLRFEARSFHRPRRVRIYLGETVVQEVQVEPTWSPVAIDLPVTASTPGGRLEVDGCVSPAEVGAGDDRRCLGLQIRGFVPRRVELYDLVNDPMAQIDLSRQRPQLRRLLELRLLARTWSPVAEPGEVALSDEARRNLKALGYLD